MNEAEKRKQFIEMVLSISDDDLPIDDSIMMSEILYRTDDLFEEIECLNERIDILEKKINTIMKYVHLLNK